MLIDQQQKSSEILKEYGKRFLDLLLKSSGLLQHQAKDLAHIMPLCMQLAQSKTTALCVRQKSNLSAKCHDLSTEKGS